MSSSGPDYAAIAAAAGVVWDDSGKYVRGHMARVLMVAGGGFFHPCVCMIGFDHDALEPQMNEQSTEPPQYAPLPDVVVPDPADANAGIDPLPTDPTQNVDQGDGKEHANDHPDPNDHANPNSDPNGN